MPNWCTKYKHFADNPCDDCYEVGTCEFLVKVNGDDNWTDKNKPDEAIERKK